jgi:hypothetical protein
MTSVDVRSRTAGDVVDVDAAELFERTLPGLFADRSDLVVPGARELGLRSLAVEVLGRSWTLDFDGDRFMIRPGADDAHAVVVLDAEGLRDLVHDLRTPMGFFTGGDLVMPCGGLDEFLDWWVVLRSVLDSRRAHVSGDVAFRSSDGDPLDLATSFVPDSDPAEQAHFLAEAGFLHLEGVFDPSEMAAISDEMDKAAPGYSQGDDRSWWARTADGADHLVRMQYFQDSSPTTAALLQDDRLTRLGALFDDGHRLGKPGPNRNLVEALVKPIGIVEGISDVPWHKDCSLGSHSYRCCSMTVGISVTGADQESGQLRVVAGSHRALIQPAFVRRGLDLPQIDLPTRTGDVTVHLSCTLHMAQPPVVRERRVLYTDFSLPRRADDRSDQGEATLRRIREGAATTVSQPPSPVAPR